MTDALNRSIVIQLSPQQATQPELLEGLEVWLRLGLLSDAEVRQLGQEYLVCTLPSTVTTAIEPDPPQADFADASVRPTRQRERSVRQSSRAPSLMTRTLQSFMAEISVVWLLFLGVFMVVVSSGVLAASQWQNFSPVGQYGILLVYTLAFWAASIWAAQRPNLRLTARMLQITTLLIIPVNFWMMDGLNLWRSGAGIGLGAIAALTLTAVNLGLLRSSAALAQTHSSRRIAVNSVGLSWLHWGWQWAGFPLVATYVGTVGTALLLFFQYRSQPASSEEPGNTTVALRQGFGSPATLTVAFAALLLISRAIFLAHVPINQLALAVGICGWLLCWLTRSDRSRIIWTRVGVGLLLLGWSVAVTADPPWQAIAVSGLGLWLLVDRLRAQGQTQALLALLLVGLQTYGLLWRVVPPNLRQTILTAFVQFAGNAAMPEALLGLAGFPYLLLTLNLASRLRQRQQLILASQAELIALILGVALTAVSIDNPVVRSLNLCLSACTLAGVVRQKSAAPPVLIYLTHGTALAAIASGIDLLLPLSLLGWAKVLLVGVAVEWSLSPGTRYPLWRRSAWHLGLALAALSYVLLLPASLEAGYESDRGLIWLVTPALLSGLSRFRQFHDAQLAAKLSIVALFTQLLLLHTLHSWVIALAVATGLMLVNTSTLRQQLVTAVTVGFGLSFAATAIWQGFGDRITGEIAVNLVALTLWMLWLLRSGLRQNNTELRRLYAQAANDWAIVLSALLLLGLTLYSAILYGLPDEASWQVAVATGLTSGAIAYRLWQQPTQLGFYGLAWAIEVLVSLLVVLWGGSIETLAIATLGLGLFTQVMGEGWVRHSGQNYRSSWQVIPLLYAGLGLLLAHTSFTASTGLYTLAAAVVGIGIGRRSTHLKSLTILAILLSSIAAYELLVYQLLQAQAGAVGDGITLLAGLAGLLALGDRLLSRWLLPYLRLSPDELCQIAHLHWALGSGLAFPALLLTLSAQGSILWLLITAVLAAYALSLGNRRWAGSVGLGSRAVGDEAASLPLSSSQSKRDPAFLQAAWTYAGIFEAIAVIGYGLYRVAPDPTQLAAWAGAIASGLAGALYFLPWGSWGWPTRPWKNSATLLPGVTVILTLSEITVQSLLITAAFYAWIAKTRQQPRLSYLSLVLLDWAVLRYLAMQGWISALWLSAVLGVSLLYVAQVDPALQVSSAKEQRHLLRTLATGIICLTAFYQAEVETETATSLVISVMTLVLGISLVALGLVLRVRAFLYVGTIAFILKILRLLWLFVSAYSLLLWAIGIIVGIAFIWIAATFEARRSQVNTLLQYWLTGLESWE